MKEDLTFWENGPSKECKNALEEVVKSGARQMLQLAIENEVQEFLDSFEKLRTEKGRRRGHKKWLSSGTLYSDRNWFTTCKTTSC